MRTEHVNIHLADYAKGSLEPELRTQVEAHLKTCLRCQQDLELVSRALAKVETVQVQSPGVSYFTSIVPRLRQRLEQKSSTTSWFETPVFSRLALPLAAATILVALSINIEKFAPANNTSKSLKPVLEGMEAEDVVDVLLQESPPVPWGTNQTQEVAKAVLGDHLTKEHFLKDALTIDLQPYFNETSLITSQDLLQSFDEDQIEALLKKLGERSTL